MLSPLAKSRGWAPGDVSDWVHGSKGWIVWISLAIMLADAVVSLGHLALRPVWFAAVRQLRVRELWGKSDVAALWQEGSPRAGYVPIRNGDDDGASQSDGGRGETSEVVGGDAGQIQALDDAPEDQQISNRAVTVGLVLSVAFCIFCIHVVFGDLVPLFATVTAVFMALVLSIMGVRALGETDLNPVSGVSKLAQLIFAFIIPQSNPSSVLINLVAGAVSEAGAMQAGDLMQDLKTGHLLGAAPKAQFWGQVIGATVGAVVSALIYQLYTS